MEDDYGILMNRLYEGRDILTPEVKSEIRALTANATSDTEKVHIVYDYLQKNTRYVSVQLGIGGWQPFDAEYVYENKYGDCKALTWFMKSMLETIGIKSYPALVSAGVTKLKCKEGLATRALSHAHYCMRIIARASSDAPYRTRLITRALSHAHYHKK